MREREEEGRRGGRERENANKERKNKNRTRRRTSAFSFAMENNSSYHEIPLEDNLCKNEDSITAAIARFARALCILTVIIMVCYIGVNYH